MNTFSYTWLSGSPITLPTTHRYDQRTDTMSETGSLRLMRKVEAYWLTKGKKINCSIVSTYGPAKVTQGPHIFCVRSDMINGLPRG